MKAGSIVTQRFLGALIVGTLLWAGTVGAADLDARAASPAPDTASRALQVTPYLWASGIRGDVSPFRAGPTVGVSKSFGDVLDNLNFGGFLHVWHRNGRYVASADAMLVDTTEDHAIERVPVFGPVRGLAAKVDTRQTTVSLQAGYRIVETAPFTLDLLAGARLWNVENKVKISYANLAISRRETLAWVDPVIGLRAFYGLTDGLSLQAQGDLGGFGAGSRLTWQVMATANYVLTNRLSVSVGYKILKTDYRSGGHVFDTTLQGPVAGLTYRF